MQSTRTSEGYRNGADCGYATFSGYGAIGPPTPIEAPTPATVGPCGARVCHSNILNPSNTSQWPAIKPPICPDCHQTYLTLTNLDCDKPPGATRNIDQWICQRCFPSLNRTFEYSRYFPPQ